MKRTADHVILGLVVLNCAVTFNWQKVKRFPSRQPVMLRHFTTSTKHLEEGRYYTLLTSVFSHADLGHLFANMVGLYFFGTQMCAVLGPRRFLGIYLGSGVLSSLATVLEQKFSDKVSMNLGASGAINSVTAMSILLNPRSTLLVFGFIPLQAWVTGSLFITKDLYGWVTDSRDGVAHFAHLSGALCGGAYYAYLRQAKKLVR
ncbi:hypothetical protein Poli38472_003239 [Pythium oligandrum]|uniref:Peptidase S54 rhomboid domain-containing protein n=1 Tax=Pythium oligandrum TaxID=41045 RepID=A0A8K1FDV6_PYTOL|nr:hypothetical protein Poli38472_003239 [Pythium oligandrum]|eukprot:TMW57314.1 hypothetical protein Poli38472_003239 [Pythium oligandrum]